MPDNSKQHRKASGGLIALAAVLALGLGAAAWWLAAGAQYWASMSRQHTSGVPPRTIPA